MRSLILALSLAAGLGSASAAAATPPSEAQYAPYAFLIGAWDLAPEGGAATAVTNFKWGPGQSYIWFDTSLMRDGKLEPHFEGMLMWNGVSKSLDMLVTIDLQTGLVQEHGTLTVQPDGSVLRDITAVYSAGVPIGPGKTAGPDGESAHFQQTFVADGADRVLTSLMRETPDGWVPTFPGSDHLVMTRRP